MITTCAYAGCLSVVRAASRATVGTGAGLRTIKTDLSLDAGAQHARFQRNAVDSLEPTVIHPPAIGAETGDRAEIRAFLLADPSRLGDVYRWTEQGLTPEEMAELADTQYTTFVWNYTRILQALLTGDLPTAPTVARATARKYRSLLKQDWSPGTSQLLRRELDILERASADIDAVVEESLEAKRNTEAVEDENTAGIYVYSLPHYVRYPFDPDTGRTLLKVGHSQRDAIQRMQAQTRTTALPEDPVLLRVYPTGDLDSAALEAKMHRTLRAFDHGRDVERMAGREWFLTTTTAIDSVADLLGLEARIVNDDADYLGS
jgi:hypothetical protein